MAVKYYSERTKQVYDTEKECMDAEFKAKEQENFERIAKEKALREEKEAKEKAAAERKAMADKVEAARKAMVQAQKDYKDALNAFVKTYGTYHFSTSNPDEVPTLFDIFDRIFTA